MSPKSIEKPLKVLMISGQYPPSIGGGGTHTYYWN
jgi:hypothetical protein